MRNNLVQKLRLCLVTNIQGDMTTYLPFIKKAVQGGVTMVQLREKGSDISDIKNKALRLKNILDPLEVPLIINDFVELAAEIDASGVHIGQQDMNAADARALLGPDKIIGVSIESFGELYAANHSQDISYVTASALFPSRTKPNCKTLWGIDDLRWLAAKSAHPITTIGGINASNVEKVFNTGVCGVAVIGAIHNSIDPAKAAKELLRYQRNELSLTPTLRL